MRFSVALFFAFFVFGNIAVGQQATTILASSDKQETIAYQTLFRQAVLYKRLADEADASHTPKPQLRRILSARYGFSDADAATLQRLAITYQAEIASIHQQAQAVIGEDQARFPSGVIPRGADTTPSPELRQLQNQEDALTLRYRDLLRASMREEDFQQTHARIMSNLNERLTH